MADIKKSHRWEKPKKHALTEDQQAAFMRFISASPRYRYWLPLFTVMLGTGCRVGEVIGLRWEDCDFAKNIISINHSLVYRQQEAGGALSPNSINRAIERIRKAYNTKETELAAQERREPLLLPHFSAHNLRHTFCTRFCENETNLKVIQEIMGHTSITTTMDIYNEATLEQKIASFQNLEGKFRLG